MSACRVMLVATYAICQLVVASQPALGVPILQLYVEGGKYDPVGQSWVYSGAPNPDGSVDFRLWIIGNPNPRGPIYDVRVSVAYASVLRSGGYDLLFSWRPSVTGGLGGFFDPSYPPAVSFVQAGPAGSRPVISGTSLLPSHGVFGPGTVWQEFRLGDFVLKDSPLGDFVTSFPQPGKLRGQINVYDVSVRHTGGMSLMDYRLHFDAYGYVLRNCRRQPVHAPFSHDAEVNVVPNPPSLVLTLWLLAGGGVGFIRHYFRHKLGGT
ncbi:MAG: choice-of-anchor N protein [Thermoguttaceae bacterium]|nr:choice-of-anchor N protein [Thermoguttaceae bacterium]MDW8077338.1 choice-of-anchor N protein [Thermoguttaceae bacterium]